MTPPLDAPRPSRSELRRLADRVQKDPDSYLARTTESQRALERAGRHWHPLIRITGRDPNLPMPRTWRLLPLALYIVAAGALMLAGLGAWAGLTIVLAAAAMHAIAAVVERHRASHQP